MMPSPDMSFPVPLIHISETNSTNSYLQALCSKQQGVAAFTTVVADFQTSGRGQRGNSWESEPKKNLLFSFVLFPDFLEARRQFLISQIVSLAIKEELDSYADDFSIKWPNDIYWKDKKICGMLIENDLMGRNISQSISGLCFGYSAFRKIILGCHNFSIFPEPSGNPFSDIAGQLIL